MKVYFFLLLCFFSTSVMAKAPASLSSNQQQYVLALEYVYAQDYQQARSLLETLFAKVPDSQVAQTLLSVYFALLQTERLSQPDADSIGQRLFELIKSDVLPETDAQRILQLFLHQSVSTGDYLLAQKTIDLYLSHHPQSIIANGMRGYIVAMQLIRRQERKQPINPFELIQYNSFVAGSTPSTQVEKYYVSQAREFMALAYNALGDRRKALSFWRLAYMIHQQPMGSLLSSEVDFLNFAYAAKHLHALNINNFDQDQRELFLGILFADGSKESLRLMDSVLSSKKTPLSPYEQALSLYRRGLTSRSMIALDGTVGTPLRTENPWFYLDLRYKQMKRLQLKDEIQPVAASLGGMSYLVGKNKLALSYLNDIDENENGEKSYLIGRIYLRENNYPKAIENFRKHLRFTNSRYYSEALDTIMRIIIQDEQSEEEIQKYLGLYQRKKGKATPDSFIIQAKIAIKTGRYDEALALEKIALEKASPDQKVLLHFDLADFYSSQWLKTNQDKQILMARARLNITQAFEKLGSSSQDIIKANFNNYAYINGLSSDMGLDIGIVKKIIEMSMENPTLEILDTAAFVAMEAFRLKVKDADDPTPYFDSLERSVTLIDEEQNYSKMLAPPYVDESTRWLPVYYEIYMHLAAWHWVNGREELSSEYEKRVLELAKNPHIAIQHLNELKQSWSQVSL
ncbi:MAG: tetratricopeptide repeat protein [Brevinema sp.]